MKSRNLVNRNNIKIRNVHKCFKNLDNKVCQVYNYCTLYSLIFFELMKFLKRGLIGIEYNYIERNLLYSRVPPTRINKHKYGFCLPQYFRFDFNFIRTGSSSDYNIQLNLMFAVLKCMIVKY